MKNQQKTFALLTTIVFATARLNQIHDLSNNSPGFHVVNTITPEAEVNGRKLTDNQCRERYIDPSGPYGYRLEYQNKGAEVMIDPVTTYAIFYGSWNEYSSTGSVGDDHLTWLLKYIGASNYFNTLSTYFMAKPNGNCKQYATTSISFGDVTYQRDYPYGNELTESELNELVIGVFDNGLSDIPVSENAIYFVFTSADVTMSLFGDEFGTDFCGAHGYLTYSGKKIKVAYIGDPTNYASKCIKENQVVSPNNSPGADAMANFVVYAIASIITNPLSKYPMNEDTPATQIGGAWYDPLGNEAGDKCRYIWGDHTYTTTNGALANINLNGRHFLVQTMWNNKKECCDHDILFTNIPTAMPTTSAPTISSVPTVMPTQGPTSAPTISSVPTVMPTQGPTSAPSTAPTLVPTSVAAAAACFDLQSVPSQAAQNSASYSFVDPGGLGFNTIGITGNANRGFEFNIQLSGKFLAWVSFYQNAGCSDPGLSFFTNSDVWQWGAVAERTAGQVDCGKPKLFLETDEEEYDYYGGTSDVGIILSTNNWYTIMLSNDHSNDQTTLSVYSGHTSGSSTPTGALLGSVTSTGSFSSAKIGLNADQDTFGTYTQFYNLCYIQE